MITISPELTIPEAELTFTAARSGGPGGQNVNKVNSKVSIEFHVATSAVLSDEQKAKIAERLRARINNDGVLRVTSQKHRTQLANREDAIARFADLIRVAFVEQKKRKQTKVSRGAIERRLQGKKIISQRKKTRSEKY